MEIALKIENHRITELLRLEKASEVIDPSLVGLEIWVD